MDKRFLNNIFVMITALVLALAGCSEPSDEDTATIDSGGNMNLAVPAIIQTTRMEPLDLTLSVFADDQPIPMADDDQDSNWTGQLIVPFGGNVDISIDWSKDAITLASMRVQLQNVVMDDTVILQEDNYNLPDDDSDGFSNLAELNALPPTDVNNGNSFPGNALYQVGDTGPAGGVVFYVADDLRLEVAPEDAGMATWGCYSELTLNAAQGTLDLSVAGTDFTASLGNGSMNTQLIVESCTPAIPGNTRAAAVVADEYTLNGFTDWFLPSRWEFQNIPIDPVLGNLNNITYWSSSQLSEPNEQGSGWALGFPTGVVLVTNKTESHGVRPIRSF